MANDTGRKLLHYELLAKIGEGGMGAVYRARDTRLDRDVAVKLLPRPVAAESPAARARFEVEARAAAALNHPNIATVHAIEDADDDMFIVMEYIDGRDLKQVAASGPLSLDRVLDIATEVADGLLAAHQKGIVHRDIKPSNIMVTSAGGIKITDFGLAKIGRGLNLTESGTTLGTVSYMSPEQLRGEPVDHRSDIWSFGVVLYELLNGRRPFSGDHDQAVVYSILNAQPEPKSASSAVARDRIDRLVRRTLEKNRDVRYQSMADVISDLRTIRQEPLGSSQKTESNRRKTASRPRLAVLPFASIRNDPDMDFLGFALADQIIGALTYVRNLLVRPSMAVRKYQHQGGDAATVGWELQVDFVLTGHYLREGDVIRLNVELVDAVSNEIVWRASIQDKYKNAFKLQDKVSKRVLRGLEIRFSDEERDRIQGDVPADPLAYEYYLRAVSYPVAVVGDRLAIEMLQKSTALDPRYAPAWVELGFRIDHLAYEAMLGLEEHRKAEQAFRKALALNGTLLSALWHLCFHCVNAGRSEEASDLIDRMFRVAPDAAMSHFARAYLYRYTGMLEESARDVERALMLDPRNPRFRSAAFTYVYRGEYRKAHDIFELDRDGTLGVAWKGMTLFLMGEKDQAVEYLDRAAAMEPESFVGLRHAAVSAFIKGRTGEGLRLLRQLESARSLDDGDAEHWYLLGNAYGLLGDSAGCIRALRKAVDGGFFSYPCFLRDPLLDSVRDMPEFQQIQAMAKEKHDGFRTKVVESGRTLTRTAARPGVQ